MKDKNQPFLSELMIVGERYYTRNEDVLRSILELGTPSTFMDQDIGVIHRQIERLPCVRQVSVRKQWPDKLKVYLVEYVPIARWNHQYMVDLDGNFFNLPFNRTMKNNLPDLYGPEGKENEVIQGFQEIEQILKRNRLILKDASMTDRHSWHLTLINGIRIDLGRTDIIKRLLRFIEIYPVLIKKEQSIGKRINYIDLRYHSGAAVGWNP